MIGDVILYGILPTTTGELIFKLFKSTFKISSLIISRFDSFSWTCNTLIKSGSISTIERLLATSTIFSLKAPCPGPISRTFS